MKALLVSCFFSILFAAVALWYLQDPGIVEIIWLGYEVHLSVATGILTLLIALFMLLLLLGGSLWLLGIPIRFISFLQDHRKREAQHHLLEQLTAFEAEKFTEALYHQKKIGKILDKNALFLWISARAFEKANSFDRAEKILLSAYTDVLHLLPGLAGAYSFGSATGGSCFGRYTP